MRLRYFPVPLNPSSVVIISKALSARSFLFTSITAVALGLLVFLPPAVAQQASALGLPVLSVLGGTFTTQQQVITSTPDAGVTLRYTVNGNTPTVSDPVVAPGGSVLITQSGTLKVTGFAGAAVGQRSVKVYHLRSN